ncbi:MAG: MBL fold metallo-hydrolase [Paracoccaceae bacterium]
MADRLRFTILGCGSSGGVPRIGLDGPNWGACDPDDPRNYRRRCALLVERTGRGGTTTLLVDAGPDIRHQLIDARAGHLDAVLLTHEHADHIHGIDDLRMVVFNRRALLPALTDRATAETLRRRFGYVFETPAGSAYPPILDLRLIDGPVEVAGAGGRIAVTPFWVPHGDIFAMGLRVGPVAYTPDISDVPEEVWPLLEGLDCWIVDALRYRPHLSHANVETALAWVARAQPQRAVLTNLHVDLDYARLDAETPAHVRPAHDGLRLDYAL